MALPAETPPPTSAFRAVVTRGREGFYRVAQDAAGTWWLVGPDGVPRFLRAVHEVKAAAAQGDGELPPDSMVRLRSWGFDAVGVPASATETDTEIGRDDGLPFMAAVEFCRSGPILSGPGLRLPDVFDPEWPRRAVRHAAEVCPPLAEERALLGWVTDARLEWAQPSLAGRPALLQLCLSLEPSFAAYHAAWEFALALHGGRLETLARAWGAPITNKEVVRELTRAEEGLGSRGYLRDEARWTREFARRYFTTTATAIRAADANHLVLGARFTDAVGSHVLSQSIQPAVDLALPDWRELATLATHDPSAPVLASNLNWVTPDFLKLPVAARMMRLTSVEWMLRRARTALDRLARNPAVVGYAWGRWEDAPGEQPPFGRGLVHANGAEAREHTELIVDFNRRAGSLHAQASAHASLTTAVSS